MNKLKNTKLEHRKCLAGMWGEEGAEAGKTGPDDG